MTATLQVLFALGAFFGLIDGCVYPPGKTPAPPMSTVAIFRQAPVVLMGRYDSGIQDTNIVNFSPMCIYKDGGLKIPSKIKLRNAFKRDSCRGTHLVEGDMYIIALDKTSTNDVFNIYEPGDMNVATKPGDDAQELQLVANLCLSKSITNPAGTNFQCPATSVDKCPASGATRIYKVSLKWGTVFSLIFILFLM